MSYTKPDDAISPKATWRLVDIVLDRGERAFGFKPVRLSFGHPGWSDLKRRVNSGSTALLD
jgi:hypothetical protein